MCACVCVWLLLLSIPEGPQSCLLSHWIKQKARVTLARRLEENEVSQRRVGAAEVQILVQVQVERTVSELKGLQKVQRRSIVRGLEAKTDKGSGVRKWTG